MPTLDDYFKTFSSKEPSSGSTEGGSQTASLNDYFEKFSASNAEKLAKRQEGIASFNSLLGSYQKKTREADRFYSSWKSQPEREKFHADFEQTLTGARDSLAKLREQYGDDRDIVGHLDEFEKQIGSHLSGLQQYEDYWGQWESQEAFDAWDAARKWEEEQLGLDLDDYARKIDAVRQEQEYYRDHAEFDGTNMKNWIAYEDKLDSYDQKISAMQQYLNQAKHKQEGKDLASASGREDFAANSGYASTQKEGWKRLWSQFGTGYGDVEYEYINDVDGFRDRLHEQARSDPGNSAQIEAATSGKGLDYITEEEAAVYNYYYKTEGKEKARQYLNSIQEALNQRMAGQIVENLGDSTAGRIGFGAFAGFDQARSGTQAAIEAFRGKEDYIPVSAAQMAGGMIRENLAETGPRLLGKSLGQAGYDLVTTTSNMMPSILTSTAVNAVLPGAGAFVGGTMMAGSAGGNAYQEALNAGWDKNQARTYAGLTAASEAGLQYLLGGISQLSGAGNVWKGIVDGVDKAYAHIALDWGTDVLGEGMEEFLQEVLDPFFRSWSFDTKRENVNWSEAMYNGILGAFSAGIIGAPERVGNVHGNKKLGAQLSESGVDAGRLAELGSLYGDDTVSGRLGKSLDEDTGDYTLGRMLKSLEGELTETNRKDIAGLLKYKGVREQDAAVIAQGVAEAVEGRELPRMAELALSRNPTVMEALQVVLGSDESNVRQRTRGLEEARAAMDQNKVKGKTTEAQTQESNLDGTVKRLGAIADGSAYLEEKSQKYGAQAKLMQRLYVQKERDADGNPIPKQADMDLYDNAFGVAYTFGQNGVKLDYALKARGTQYLSQQQIELAYEAGQAAAGRNQKMEVSNGTEEIRLRDGSQRADGADSGGEVQSLGAASRAAEEENSPGESGAVRENPVHVQGKVGAQDFGIPGGTAERNLRTPTGKDTSSMKKARAVAQENGMEIQFFEGGNLRIMDEDGHVFEARAYVDTEKGKMYVRSDHGIPAHKLAKHEAGHQQVARGEIDVDAVYDKMVELYGGERYVRKLIDIYAAAFDGSGMTAEEIFEEILCDSVAEINAFGRSKIAQDFQKRVKKEVESEPVRGSESRGPPEKGKGKFSFAGTNAETADMLRLETAERMEKEMHDTESIRQETGWFRGYDGKWRFELDDSEMRISLKGFFRNPDIMRYNELSGKLNRDTITDEELDELGRLGDNLQGVRKRPETLGEYVKHDALFTAYPELWNETVKFERMHDGMNGYYNPSKGEIVLNQKLRADEAKLKDTLIHEIQHAVQEIEGHTKGASIEHWERQLEHGFDSRNEDQKELSKLLWEEYGKVQRERPEFFRELVDLMQSAPNIPRGVIDWNTLEQIEEDPIEWQRFDARRDELEEKYGDDIFDFMELYHDTVEAEPKGRSAEQLYFDTAGEVEARDTAARREMNQEQRKNTRPDIDREDVVFADGETSYSFSFDEGGKTGTESKIIIQKMYDNLDKVSKTPRFDLSIDDTPAKYQKKTDYILDIFKAQGNMAHNSAIGNVELVKSGAKSTIGHGFGPAKLAAARAIKDVIENGDIVLHTQNYEGKEIDRYIIAARGKIDNIDAYIAVVVKTYPTMRQNAKFYLHEAVIVKEDSLSMTAPQLSVDTVGESSSTTNISNPGEKVKGKTSREAVGAAKIEQSKNLLQQQVEYWLGKPKKHNGQFARPEDVRRVVREILAEYQSTVDKTETTKAMQKLADLIIKEGDEVVRKGYSDSGMTYDEIRAYAADIAWEIVGNSQVLANENDMELYDEIKSYLRKMPITLREESDIADFKDFRKRNFGRLLLKKDGNPIDTVWPELQDAFGKGFFPDDITHPADMMLHLEELLNSMDPVYYNPYDGSLPQNVEACANTIVDKLFSEAVQPVSTYMDQELEGLARQIRENEEDIRRLKQEKDQLQKQNELLGKEADGVNKYREARNKTQMKNQIRNTAKELDKILNKGTKERNVKEGLRETAGATLRLAQVLFSDMRMETVLYGMDTYATTAKERKAIDKYIQLASKRDHLKERKKKLLKEAGESAQAWLDTEDARNDLDEQLKTVREQMAPLADELQSVAERERNRLKGQGMVGRAIDEMAMEYKKLAAADEEYLRGAYNTEVFARMLEVKENLNEAFIGDMTMEQMQDVYSILQMMMSAIRGANKHFAEDIKETVTESYNNMNAELSPMQKAGRWTLDKLQAINKFHWNNEKPIYAMLRIGSQTLTKLYKNIRKGEDVWQRDTEAAKEFRIETEKIYGFKDWDFEKKYAFKSNTGMRFDLTLQEIMSLYAYSKRKQAWEHLTKGGFVFDPNAKRTIKTKMGLKLEVIPENATSYNVSLDVWGDIVKVLSEQQRAFVDEMQAYLSTTMGEKGNEVSRKLYGVPLFREKFYFPLRSSPVYNARVKEQQAGEIKIKNKGFTKETVKDANNPIVLTPFMDLWADHVNEMSMYHGMTLPLEDFYRVYNFGKNPTEADATSGTAALIQNAHGSGAVAYIDQLLKDINAGRTADPREGMVKTMTAKFKKASVMASLSVLLRQFSAGPRAWAMVDPKYFVGRKLGAQKHKETWKEMKQYAPVCGIKEMGYFDTGLGRSARDYLLAEEYEGAGEKIKAFLKDGDYRDEVLGMAPGWADEVTWIGIWNAVKRETKATRKDLEIGSEEFMEAVGERFTDVIEMTQVYDSVFARSANMRSGSAAMSAITAFMAEPTTTINMVEHAARSFIKGDKKQAVKTMKAVTTAIILDSLLGSIIYAMRDDDEDKNLAEKYVENVVGNLLTGINVLTYIPVVRDIWSMAQGFDVERADMSLLNTFLDAVTDWGRIAGQDTSGMDADELAAYKRKKTAAAWKVVDGLFALHGDSVRNIRRDILAFQNLLRPSNWAKSSGSSIWDAMVSGKNSATPFVSWMDQESRTDKLYAAILSGDEVYRKRLESQYKNGDAVHAAIRSGLRENDPRIRRAAEAWNKEDWKTYMSLHQEVQAGGFDKRDVGMAIKAEANALKPKDETEKPDKAYSMFTLDSYTSAILSDSQDMADTIKKEILATEQENGKTPEEAEKSLESGVKSRLKDKYLEGTVADQTAERLLTERCGMDQEKAAREVAEWSFEEEYDLTYSERIKAYKAGELTAGQLKAAMMEVGGYSAEDADSYIELYDWEKLDIDGAEDMDRTGIGIYKEKAEPNGVPKERFIKIYSVKKNAKGTDLDGDGKKDDYSVVKEVMPQIGNLPISDVEKDALALCFWSKTTVRKYKTW